MFSKNVLFIISLEYRKKIKNKIIKPSKILANDNCIIYLTKIILYIRFAPKDEQIVLYQCSGKKTDNFNAMNVCINLNFINNV